LFLLSNTKNKIAMGQTLQKDRTPDGFGIVGLLADIKTKNFKLTGGTGFCIINENEDAVTLEIKCNRMTTFQAMKIYPNANLFFVKEVKVNASLTDAVAANLKFGQ
jgi:hypothetical protein